VPVRGFLPVLAFLVLTEKVPKPARATGSPLLKLFLTAAIVLSNALPANALEMPASSATRQLTAPCSYEPSFLCVESVNSWGISTCLYVPVNRFR
jgi:hypothetical protein